MQSVNKCFAICVSRGVSLSFPDVSNAGQDSRNHKLG